MPARGPYRILHISDIHFGSRFDPSLWEYLCALARREKPDLVACTGDVVDHGGLFMLAIARLELEGLRRAGGDHSRLSVVPGNHDCGPFGNWRIRPFSTNFAAVFGPLAMRLPRSMPAFLAYKRRHWLLRLPWRALLTLQLYLLKYQTALRCWRQGRSLADLPILRGDDDPESPVLIHLDSNHRLWLATGNVDPARVTQLKSTLLNLRDAPGARAFVPRIALVHHHLLPIPEASIREGLTSFEPFLVLRNAGLVLRELNRCDVDLVLHGHKHYSAFTRLGYSVDHKVEGELAVLAAGSCGITISESGRNAVNLIDVFETGKMSYTPVHYGGGAGAAINELFRDRRDVHGMDMHKARMFRRAAERQGQWVEEIVHAVAIDPGGVAVVRHDVRGHSFDRNLPSSVIPVRIDVSMGRVSPTTLELTEESRRAGHVWVDPPTAPSRSIRCGIDLGQRLATSPPTDYGYQYICFNSYAISEWETQAACERDQALQRLFGRTPGLESTSVVIRVPTRLLIFRLQLPAGQTRSEPMVRVMRFDQYPDTPLDPARFFDACGFERWSHESDLSELERGNLMHVGNDVWELRVRHPLVGHRYDVKWRIVGPVHLGTTAYEAAARRGRAEAHRRALLESTASESTMWARWSKDFHSDLLPDLAAGLPRLDDLNIALFVYDPQRHVLCQRRAYPETMLGLSSEGLEVPLGEGVVGAAFKRSGFVMYIDPVLSGRKDDAAYLYDGAPDGQWTSPKWKYVAAFPIFAIGSLTGLEDELSKDWGPEATVGVLTIASCAPDSGLLKLTEGSQASEGSAGGQAPGTAIQTGDDAKAQSPEGAESDAGAGDLANARAEDRLTAETVWLMAHLLLAGGAAADSRRALPGGA